MEWLFTVFVFFGVIAVTALLFGGWLIFVLVRLVVRGIASIVDPGTVESRPVVYEGLVCRNSQCRCVNPAGARYCRRCGGALPQVQRVETRRAAML
ncbi:MAG: hypothetical protein ACREJC_15100 [Tepidisphaeraceae bacterium]